MASRHAADRTIVAQIAAAERWGRTADRTAATAPARAGLRAKYAREVDPDGTMPAAELERRVDSLMRAHMLRMSLKAKQARQRAKTATREAESAEQALTEIAGGPDAAA